MNTDFIDGNSFDARLGKLLKNKKGKGIVVGRYDIEEIDLLKKSDFIIRFLLSIKFIRGMTYKILFWEQNDIIKKFIINNQFNNKKFKFLKQYRNGKFPGVLFVDDIELDERFLKLLLDNHFNFEMAEEPSLNLRVQICINQEEFITLLDIYDDRGFDIYYLGNVIN